MAEMNMGTLYDLNKNLIQKNISALEEGVLNSKKEIVKNFLRDTKDTYYMLLCHEQRDYTVFKIDTLEDSKYNEMISILIDECLKNRGIIKSIELTKDKQAIEIWLMIEEEAFVYYLFPYGEAVITV